MMETNQIIILKDSGKESATIHYEIDPSLPPLGEGNMGVVRQGTMVDEKTGVRRPVAIKFLYDDLGQGAIKRSEREASIRIVHENLVEMIDFVIRQDNRGFYRYHVVSELLDGVMLLDILNGEVPEDAEVGKVDEYMDLLINDRNAFAIKVVRGVLSGILTLHDNGFIHRDIDPSNVMITKNGKVKLIDLGIAKSLEAESVNSEHLTATGDFVGKPAFAAPELVRGDVAHQDETTDIYAVGIMLYQMVTGKLPFTGSMNEVLEMQLKKSLPLKNVKDKGIRKIIKKATEKKQSERYKTAAEFRADLDSWEPVLGSSNNNWLVYLLICLSGAIVGIVLGCTI